MRVATTVPIIGLLTVLSLAGCFDPADGGRDCEMDSSSAATSSVTGFGVHDVPAPLVDLSLLQAETIKIGMLSPLSGDYAFLGETAENGARLAVEEINAAGGIDGKMLELVSADTQLDAAIGLQEFNRLAGNGVEVIVGALGSSVSGAIKPAATEKEVVLISPASTRPDLTGPDHGYFYRVIASDAVQGPQAAAYIFEDLAADEAAVLYQSNQYGTGLKDEFVKAFKAAGGTIVGAPVAYSEDATQHPGKAATVVACDPAFVYISGQGVDAASMIDALRDQGYTGMILASEAIEDEKIFESYGASVDGVLFTKSSPDPESQSYKKFQSDYQARFGRGIGPFDVYAYDAVYVFAAAIDEVGYNGAAVKEWLDANAVTGRVSTPTIQFNSNGDVTTGGYVLFRINYDGQGSFTPYDG